MGSEAFYSRPDWYDLIHADGTEDEVWLLERLHQAHGNGGDRWLEPACGSGRYLAALAKKGRRITGYDNSTKMARYARRRLAGKAEIVQSDMTTFYRPGAFDVAFNLISTFRHLLTEAQAQRHLTLTARSLKPGGLYILGLDLVDYDEVVDDEETWYSRRGRRRAAHVALCLSPDRRKRRERIINFLTLTEGKKSKLVESAYDLRSYDRRQFLSLVKSSPFKLEAVYGPDGRKTKLSGATRDAFFVLKKK